MTTPERSTNATAPADRTAEQAKWHDEVMNGSRCYDCGETYDPPLDDEHPIQDQAEFDRLYPEHAHCFE